MINFILGNRELLKDIVVILSPVLTLLAIPIITTLFSSRNQRNLMREKWMADLRDTVSEFLMYCEILRLENHSKTAYLNIHLSNQNSGSIAQLQKENEIKGNLVRLRKKIDLLFKIRSNDRANLIPLVDQIIALADKLGQKANEYLNIEEKISEAAKLILENEWGKVNNNDDIWNGVVFSVVLLYLVFFLSMVQYYGDKMN